MNETPHTVSIEIRRAAQRDLKEIGDLFLESAAFHADLDSERYVLPALETVSARYREALHCITQEDSPTILLVAELNCGLVGFVEARLEQSLDTMHRQISFCHISEIAVRKAFRNKGVGRILLQAAEGWGRLMNAAFASLEFHADNKLAEAFYDRQGYRPAAIISIKRL